MESYIEYCIELYIVINAIKDPSCQLWLKMYMKRDYELF